jgi:hypothetical protein
LFHKRNYASPPQLLQGRLKSLDASQQITSKRAALSKPKSNDGGDVCAPLQVAIHTCDSHIHNDDGNHIRIHNHGLHRMRKTLSLALVRQLPHLRQSPQQRPIQQLKFFS